MNIEIGLCQYSDALASLHFRADTKTAAKAQSEYASITIVSEFDIAAYIALLAIKLTALN